MTRYNRKNRFAGVANTSIREFTTAGPRNTAGIVNVYGRHGHHLLTLAFRPSPADSA